MDKITLMPEKFALLKSKLTKFQIEESLIMKALNRTRNVPVLNIELEVGTYLEASNIWRNSPQNSIRERAAMRKRIELAPKQTNAEYFLINAFKDAGTSGDQIGQILAIRALGELILKEAS